MSVQLECGEVPPDDNGNVADSGPDFSYICCLCPPGTFMSKPCIKLQPSTRECTPCQFDENDPSRQYYTILSNANQTCLKSIETCPGGMDRISGNTTYPAMCLQPSHTSGQAQEDGWKIALGVIGGIIFITSVLCFLFKDRIRRLYRRTSATELPVEYEDSSDMEMHQIAPNGAQSTSTSGGNGVTRNLLSESKPLISTQNAQTMRDIRDKLDGTILAIDVYKLLRRFGIPEPSIDDLVNKRHQIYTRGITVKAFEALISLGDVFNPNSLHDKLKQINQNCADILKQYCKDYDIELNTDDASS
ncbi:unnamed protein product [Clavelina lepadiformis]|uniref:TNFR-Cys domain-containing protein n=1 Tax=Clavelina lepadiformis TaxID=159417 RepID=A0ABP0FLX3_CLALP